jgi:hypothetical protein
VLPSLDIIHLVTKPVVDAEFLQDWLRFLSQDQGFNVHLLYSDDAFRDDPNQTLAERFPKVKLHRIEMVSRHGAKDQAFVLLADYLDLRYLSHAIHPALVHSHDTRSLLLARILFPHSTRLHSWWLEDRSAHRLWRVTVERLADYRTWETTHAETSESGAIASLSARQIPLPTPVTLTEEYERGEAFYTIKELYRTILRDADLRIKT